MQYRFKRLARGRVRKAELHVFKDDVFYNRRDRQPGRAFGLCGPRINRRFLCFELPVGPTLLIDLQRDFHSRQKNSCNAGLAGKKRHQIDLGFKAAELEHFGLRTPWRVGERYAFQPERGGERDSQIKITGDHDLAARRFFHLLSNQIAVRVEVHRLEDGHPRSAKTDQKHNSRE